MSKTRPIVTGITLNILYPDGSNRTVTVDPSTTEGIFWSDQSVKSILAPFYDSNKKIAPLDELQSTFGQLAVGNFTADANGQVEITSKLIEQLWESEDEEGRQPPVIMKQRKCIPTRPTINPNKP
jgi:hypothetical protein